MYLPYIHQAYVKCIHTSSLGSGRHQNLSGCRFGKAKFLNFPRKVGLGCSGRVNSLVPCLRHWVEEIVRTLVLMTSWQRDWVLYPGHCVSIRLGSALPAQDSHLLQPVWLPVLIHSGLPARGSVLDMFAAWGKTFSSSQNQYLWTNPGMWNLHTYFAFHSCVCLK